MGKKTNKIKQKNIYKQKEEEDDEKEEDRRNK